MDGLPDVEAEHEAEHGYEQEQGIILSPVPAPGALSVTFDDVPIIEGQDEEEEEPRRAKRRPVAGSGGAHTSAFGSRCDASRMTLSTMRRLMHRRRTRRHETCVGRTCRACNDSEGTRFMICGWWFDG